MRVSVLKQRCTHQGSFTKGSNAFDVMRRLEFGLEGCHGYFWKSRYPSSSDSFLGTGDSCHPPWFCIRPYSRISYMHRLALNNGKLLLHIFVRQRTRCTIRNICLYSLRRHCPIGKGIPIINLRRSQDRVKCMMGIRICLRWCLLSDYRHWSILWSRMTCHCILLVCDEWKQRQIHYCLNEIEIENNIDIYVIIQSQWSCT